jgi:cytochrome c peroxidase
VEHCGPVRRGAAVLAVLCLAAGCEDELADPFLPELRELTNIPDPPADTSNKYALLPAAQALGKKLYFDPHFSGREVSTDMLLRAMPIPGRVPTGQLVEVSCNSCHDVARGGSDHTSNSHVSMGGGAYDVNGQQTINAAYNRLVYWNGRNDSLWSQIVAVAESHVSVNSTRLKVAWRIVDKYRAEYEAVFPDDPIPAPFDSIAAHKARLEPDGTCTLQAGVCDPTYCHETYGRCTPRFPLEGKPEYLKPGQLSTCDPSTTDDVLKPFNDAYDCMRLEDQLAVTRIYVNWAKAIAAYEYTLISRDSPFDRWVAGGFQPGQLGFEAERGARLFVGKAACAECHKGPLMQDDEFHMIGIPQAGDFIPRTNECPAGDPWCDCVSDDRSEPLGCLPIGYRDGLRKLQASKFRRDGVWSDDEECQRKFTMHGDISYVTEHPDECDGRVGYYAIRLFEDAATALRGQWKTPGLRDVAETGPYMHNGQYDTLREVVEHYNRGGVSTIEGELIGTLDTKIAPLLLTEQEITDLVAFLESLTSTLDPAITSTPEIPPASDF